MPGGDVEPIIPLSVKTCNRTRLYWTVDNFQQNLQMKEYASDHSRILVADLSQMNRREIKKKRIAFKICIAVPRVRKI